MGKLEFNILEIRNSVQPQLNLACSNLQSAANSISSIKIPSKFNCYNLVSMKSKIASIKENVKSINNEISSAISRFETAQRQTEELVNNLSWLYMYSNPEFRNECAQQMGIDTNEKTTQQIIHEIEICEEAKRQGIDIEGKSTKEILQELIVISVAGELGEVPKGLTHEELTVFVAQKLNIPTTEFVTEIVNLAKDGSQFAEMQLLNQKDYNDITFGKKTISTSGCGPTSFLMLVTGALGIELDDVTAREWLSKFKSFAANKGIRI